MRSILMTLFNIKQLIYDAGSYNNPCIFVYTLFIGSMLIRLFNHWLNLLCRLNMRTKVTVWRAFRSTDHQLETFNLEWQHDLWLKLESVLPSTARSAVEVLVNVLWSTRHASKLSVRDGYDRRCVSGIAIFR